MKRIRITMALSAIFISLSGCISEEIARSKEPEDIAWCQSMGATEQNGALAQCVQGRQQQRFAAIDARRARAAAWLQQYNSQFQQTHTNCTVWAGNNLSCTSSTY